MKAFFPETCPKYPRSVMRTGDGIPAGRVADGLFHLSPQPYVQLHESADVSQIEIVERSIFGRVGIDLSRVRVIEHIHEMQHLSCLLSCEHRTKFLNMHNNPIHIGLESPAPGMIRAAALSKLDARIQFVSATLVFGLAAFDCSLAISSSHTSLGVL